MCVFVCVFVCVCVCVCVVGVNGSDSTWPPPVPRYDAMRQAQERNGDLEWDPVDERWREKAKAIGPLSKIVYFLLLQIYVYFFVTK